MPKGIYVRKPRGLGKKNVLIFKNLEHAKYWHVVPLPHPLYNFVKARFISWADEPIRDQLAYKVDSYDEEKRTVKIYCPKRKRWSTIAPHFDRVVKEGTATLMRIQKALYPRRCHDCLFEE